MEPPVNLFARRTAELDELVSKHLDAGSLDEASATVFDGIIDGWHREARSQLDAQHARAKADSAARLTAADEALRIIDERLAALREQRDAINQRLHDAETLLLGNGIDPATMYAVPRSTPAATRSVATDPPDSAAICQGDDGNSRSDDLPDAA